jgi:dipeptidyl aminopeptidase/acylaminoacyl peptidase
MVFDREKKTTKELMPEFDNWVDEFTWAPDSKEVFFASPYQGREPIFRVGMDGAQVEMLGLSGEFGDIRLIGPSGGNEAKPQIVATGMSVDHPAQIGVASGTWSRYPSTGQCDGCFAVVRWLENTDRQTIDRLDLSRIEPFWFTGAEGTKVEGFMLKPPNFDPAKKYPVKFLMHGGPQTAWGDAWSYRWNWELMAASGYVVIGINRRGSTGYGQKFVDEVSGDWGGRAYQDLMKGLDYAETKFTFIDKNRECALGASYGGFMANWVLTHTNRFKCIVTHDGMFDPVSAYGSTEEMWFNEWEFRRPEDFPKGWDGFSAGYDPLGKPTSQNRDVGHPDTGHAAEPWRYQNLPADEDPFRKWSPLRFIEHAKTPTLVIHSQRDMRLDVSQGFELFTALQRLGVPSKFLYFPDEGHWVLKPQNSQLWYETVGDWCDRWTKDAGNREQGTGNRTAPTGNR